MKLRYFAWVRVQIGRAEEEVALDPEIRTVADLIAWLAARGPGYARALARPEVIRVAINQDYVAHGHPVRPGDEVALFPPITGG